MELHVLVTGQTCTEELHRHVSDCILVLQVCAEAICAEAICTTGSTCFIDVHYTSGTMLVAQSYGRQAATGRSQSQGARGGQTLTIFSSQALHCAVLASAGGRTGNKGLLTFQALSK
ncbi:hypothetical protein ABBQ32_008450 [Trebouxia sp. C0010 RCD-2024]